MNNVVIGGDGIKDFLNRRLVDVVPVKEVIYLVVSDPGGHRNTPLPEINESKRLVVPEPRVCCVAWKPVIDLLKVNPGENAKGWVAGILLESEVVPVVGGSHVEFSSCRMEVGVEVVRVEEEGLAVDVVAHTLGGNPPDAGGESVQEVLDTPGVPPEVPREERERRAVVCPPLNPVIAGTTDKVGVVNEVGVLAGRHHPPESAAVGDYGKDGLGGGAIRVNEGCEDGRRVSKDDRLKELLGRVHRGVERYLVAPPAESRVVGCGERGAQVAAVGDVAVEDVENVGARHKRCNTFLVLSCVERARCRQFGDCCKIVGYGKMETEPLFVFFVFFLSIG